jgi:hypothetical protein
MAKGRPLDVTVELIEAFRHSGAVSAYLATAVPPAIWRVAPPGGRGRTIAAIFAHLQGVRRTFARLGGLRPGPPTLDKERVTPAQAGRTLRQSADDLAGLFEAALAAGRAGEEHAATDHRRAHLPSQGHAADIAPRPLRRLTGRKKQALDETVERDERFLSVPVTLSVARGVEL